MKYKYFTIILIMLILLVGVQEVFAQTPTPTLPPTPTSPPLPSGGRSGVQVVNLSATPANIEAIYYYENPGPATKPYYEVDKNVTLPSKQSYTFFAEPVDEFEFEGSAIVSSDQPIASIVMTEFASKSNLNYLSGAYNGIDAGSSEVWLPLVTKNHTPAYKQTTAISIQNTDRDDPHDITLTITRQGGGETIIETYENVLPGASIFVDVRQFDVAYTVDGFLGSAVVESDDDSPSVAAKAMVYSYNWAYIYSGFITTSKTVYLPLIRSGFAKHLTGVQVVDAEGVGGQVTITYSGAFYANHQPPPVVTPYTCQVTAELIENSSFTFYNEGTNDFDKVWGASSAFISGGDCQTMGHIDFNDAASKLGFPGSTFLGAATITAENNVAVVVNDLAESGNSSAAYNGAFISEANDRVVSPLARIKYYGFTSGTQIQNICTETVTISPKYSTSAIPVIQQQFPDPPTLEDIVIPAGGAGTLYIADKDSRDIDFTGWLGSLEVENIAPADNCLVGITNDAWFDLDRGGDASLFNTISLD